MHQVRDVITDCHMPITWHQVRDVITDCHMPITWHYMLPIALHALHAHYICVMCM
jgi:hypothetical protein